MSNAEANFRSYLGASNPLLSDTFDVVFRPNETSDRESVRLSHALCFEPTTYQQGPERVFSESLPYMVAHGLRQAVLARAVLLEDDIRHKLPEWVDEEVFLRGLVVADAGLVHISPDEVAMVNRCGPKFAQEYARHPLIGYRMAEQLSPLETPQSRAIALMIARHHAVQSRRSYGPTWRTLAPGGVDPDHIDGMSALLKPFDFFDDFFSREETGKTDFVSQAQEPHQRFSAHYGRLLQVHASLFDRLERDGMDPQLPLQMSALIVDKLVENDSPIRAMYAGLRPDLH